MATLGMLIFNIPAITVPLRFYGRSRFKSGVID